jgi:hypothetical protein
MLINLVGRPAVEAALATTGMADPALDRPFLTTREMFILKLDQWPALAMRYITENEAGRRALLASTVDRAPLPGAAAAAWSTPRDINSLEWFASADDICRAYTSLAALARRPGLASIGQVLSLNDGGLQLDQAQWKTTWFKGGSEPGVLSLTYLATTQTGQSYVVTVLAENPSQPINEAKAAPVLLSAIKGGVHAGGAPLISGSRSSAARRGAQKWTICVQRWVSSLRQQAAAIRSVAGTGSLPCCIT